MAKKILSILETAYRGTLEEQDDTILWFTHAVKNAGADVSVLLRSGAVNYAVKGQDASGLSFGEVRQVHAPEIDKDLQKMIGKGIAVFMVVEDAQDRGLEGVELISGIEKIGRNALPGFLDEFDQIWHW